MEIRRGEPPKSVERHLAVEITSEEVLTILTNYIKRKMNTDRIRIDEVGATLSKETGKLVNMTLSGAEVLQLNWKTPAPADPAATEPAK
jgi:hypothetical protein